MAKKRNIEPASVFDRSGIRAIRARAIEVLLYIAHTQNCIDSEHGEENSSRRELCVQNGTTTCIRKLRFKYRDRITIIYIMAFYLVFAQLLNINPMSKPKTA